MGMMWSTGSAATVSLQHGHIQGSKTHPCSGRSDPTCKDAMRALADSDALLDPLRSAPTAVSCCPPSGADSGQPHRLCA